MSKQRQEDVEEEEVAPFWMISFSDLMTLLLSFFIILFSMSTLEKEKMEQIMEAMAVRFVPLRDRAKTPRADTTQSKPKQPTAHESQKVEPTEKSAVKGTIIPFPLEETELDDENKESLNWLAENLKESSLPILIRGHASNKETTRRVVDDFAYERAWNVRKCLETLDLAHRRFILVIIGPNEPLSDELLSPRFGDENTYVEVLLQETDHGI